MKTIDVTQMGGIKSDLLYYSRDSIKNKNTILNNLKNILSIDSTLWQSCNKSGRRRVVIGPRDTGLIGGRGNKIVPSISVII